MVHQEKKKIARKKNETKPKQQHKYHCYRMLIAKAQLYDLLVYFLLLSYLKSFMLCDCNAKELLHYQQMHESNAFACFVKKIKFLEKCERKAKTKSTVYCSIASQKEEKKLHTFSMYMRCSTQYFAHLMVFSRNERIYSFNRSTIYSAYLFEFASWDRILLMRFYKCYEKCCPTRCWV